MYQYKVSNEDSKKVKQLTESADVEKLLKQINNINKSFATSSVELDNDVSFEKLNQVNKTDDELLKEAQNSLYDYKKSSLDKINNDTTTKQQELVRDIDNVETQAIKDKNNIASYYDNAREEAGNDALKRGLARSSIVINTLDAFNDDEIASYKQIDDEVSNKVNALNFEINALNSQRESALNDFDIEYAVKLDATLSQLKKELGEQQMAITKYNNDIAKAEEDYKIKYANLENTLNENAWDKEMDLFDIYSEYGASMMDKYKSNKIYSLVKDYLLQFDSAEAKNILETNEELKKALGNKYSTLINEL